jgi:hypothetical protein
MREVVKEDVSDDQFDTTAATRTSISAIAQARMSLRLRLMALPARLEQKNPDWRYPSRRLPPG